MRPSRGLSLERIVLLLVVGFVGAFALAPAGYLFAVSLHDGGGIAGVAAVLAETGTRASIGQSLLQGTLSALVGMALGYPAGVFLGRYRWRGDTWVRSLLLVPFLLPSLVVVVGLGELFGRSGFLGDPLAALRFLASGLPGIVATNLLFNVPVIVLFTASGCEASSVELEESVAALGGGPLRAYRECWAGPSWTGAACGGLLTFVFSALSFAPPLLLCRAGCATVEVRVWQLAAGSELDPAAAGLLSLVLVVGFLAPALAYLLLARRLSASAAAVPAPRRRPVPWRSPAAWGLAAAMGLVLATETSLLAVVVLRSLLAPNTSGFGVGWSLLFASRTADRLGITVGHLLLNTVGFAALAAVVGLLVALASAFVGARRPGASLALGLVVFVPVLLSPIVLAFALSAFWGPLLGGEPNVWLLIVLSQGLLGLPLALQSLELPLAALPASVRESAQTLGASSWGAFVDAELPRLSRGVETAALFSLALGLGEFTATYFLVTPQFTTLSVAVYAFQQRGLFAASAPAAALLLLLSLAVYATTVAGARRASR